MSRRKTALVTVVLIWALAWLVPSPCLAASACYKHTYLGHRPDDKEPHWNVEAQGLAHDDTHWYITQRGRLWRIPVEHDLAEDVNCSDLGVSCVRLSDVTPLDNRGYDHFGDPVYYNGAVYVPVEHADKGKHSAVIAFFRGDETLEYGDFAFLDFEYENSGGDERGTQGGHAAWCAIGPDGLLYSSSERTASLFRYSIDWALIGLGGHDWLRPESFMPLVDENGIEHELNHMQGGEFSEDGTLLYLTNGDSESNCDCGIHVFEIKEGVSGPVGELVDASVGETLAHTACPPCQGLQTPACQGDGDCEYYCPDYPCGLSATYLCGPFFYCYDEGGAERNEPEGITTWDLDDGRAPGIRGQVHALVLDNDAPSALDDDDVEIKHYKAEKERIPPEITCPADSTVECTAVGGTPRDDAQLDSFFGGVTATDACDPEPTVTNDAPELFNVGNSTVVTFTATDRFGNRSSCTSSVTVVDTAAPEIADVSVSRPTLWPPNHKLADETVNYLVTDVCDSSPTCGLSVMSSEAVEGTGGGDTAPDWEVVDDRHLKLRSERSGTGPGREYRITTICSDEHENSSTEEVSVVVPHDQSGHANSGSGFSATGTGFLPSARSFELVVTSLRWFDARLLNIGTARVGNSLGALDALEGRVMDANGDGMVDVVFAYSVEAARSLMSASGEDDPLAFRYGTADGLFYLVPNIFQLGPPLRTGMKQALASSPLRP